MNDFFKLLRKTRKSFVWHLTKKGQIRGYRPEKPGVSYCPITAVCYNEIKHSLDKKRGVYISQSLAGFAADALTRMGKLPNSFNLYYYDITEAADTKTLNPKVRQRLLKNLNLD